MACDPWTMMLHRTPDLAVTGHLVTLSLRQTGSDLLAAHVDLLRAAWRLAAISHPFHPSAAVILPDRMLAVWLLPGQGDPAPALACIAGSFADALARRHGTPPAARLWRPPQCRGLADPRAIARAVDRVLAAPVRAGLAPRPDAWLLSSIHRDLRDRAHLSAAA